MARSGIDHPLSGNAYIKGVAVRRFDEKRIRARARRHAEEAELAEQIARGDFSEVEIRTALENGRCPFCGAGPFAMVLTHIAHAHKLYRDRMKELAGVYYSKGFVTAELRARQAELGRNRPPGPPSKPKSRKRKLSAAAHRRNLAQLLAVSSDDERRRASVIGRRAGRPILEWLWYVAKEREEHGTIRMYRRGCKCSYCLLANSAVHESFMKRRLRTVV